MFIFFLKKKEDPPETEKFNLTELPKTVAELKAFSCLLTINFRCSIIDNLRNKNVAFEEGRRLT